MMYNLLFIDNKESLKEEFKTLFSNLFDNIYEADNKIKAYDIYKKNRPSVMIINIDLPTVDGLSFIEEIRKKDLAIKAIVLTEFNDFTTLLKATELKLTKFLTKPLDLNSLKEAVITAKKELQCFEVVPKNSITLADGYSWDLKNKSLYKNFEPIKLTKKEIQILTIFFTNRYSIITYEMLLHGAWESFDSISVDLVKTAIKKIRKKLPKDTITNIYGIGYKLNL